MAENENVVVEEVPEVQPQTPEAPQSNGPTGGQKFKAGVKEWFRKKIVALKRKPQTIALLVLAITTIYFMLALYTFSQAINISYEETSATGICIFISTLVSLLVLVSFLNAFPKRKKANIFFVVLVFLMIGGMVACDLVYYIQMSNYMGTISNPSASTVYATINKAQPYMIVHVVLLGVSAIVFALTPVFKILINKINTQVKLESATENMHGEIDIQED